MRRIDAGTAQYCDARGALDYAYHKRPILARQHLQNTILRKVLLNDKALPREGAAPWIVFTAGAMGVGKSHALLSLHAEGLFPLDTFQAIDPDKLKGELPVDYKDDGEEH